MSPDFRGAFTFQQPHQAALSIMVRAATSAAAPLLEPWKRILHISSFRLYYLQVIMKKEILAAVVA
jgi:hypothetical protein